MHHLSAISTVKIDELVSVVRRETGTLPQLWNVEFYDENVEQVDSASHISLLCYYYRQIFCHSYYCVIFRHFL